MKTFVKSEIEPATGEARRRAKMDELFTSYAADVYAFALRRTTPSAAPDVVSETFLVAWRRLDAIPPSPKAWLLGVARRVLANQRRTDGRLIALHRRLESPNLSASHPATAELAESAAHTSDSEVLAALAVLTPLEREAITLLAWDELSAEEASIVLGCSTTAFYVRVHRARRRLAAALGTTIDRQEADPS
jgi:RNA polymerase sigma-70 factor (ECF subfamily)